jgi:RAB protein geranylgeranyltransferase component A
MELDDTFDAIVIGTGLVESILAAALARAGKKVLHVDQNQFYGSDWSTLTPFDFTCWYTDTNSTSNFDDSERVTTHAPFTCSSTWNFDDERKYSNSAALSAAAKQEHFDTNLEEDLKEKSTEVRVEVPKKKMVDKETNKRGWNNRPSSKISPKFSHESIGELVETQFGLGVIGGCHRSSGTFVVDLDWTLSNGKAATMYIQPKLLFIAGKGTIVNTSFGRGIIEKVHQPMSSMKYSEYCINNRSQNQTNNLIADMYQVQLQDWTLANSQHPIIYLMPGQLLKSSLLARQHQRHRQRKRSRGPPPVTTLERVMHNRQRYHLDLSPHIILSSGKAVDTLVRSGVHEYVEFLSLDEMFVVVNESENKNGSSSKFKIQPVPCSKADVFKTKTLSMLDKRILMKFLRFVMDIHTNEGNVLNKNEKSLGKGRSLTRPQNAPTLAYPDYEEYFDQPLSIFYKRCQMSPKLQSIVSHAIGYVSVLPSEIKTKDGLRMIANILLSLGKFNKSPFLCVKYGNSELPQAFCRLCAVYGGVYMLRVRPLSFLVREEKGKGNSEEKGNGEETSEEYVSGITLEDPNNYVNNPKSKDSKNIVKSIKSKHVFVAPEYVEQLIKGMKGSDPIIQKQSTSRTPETVETGMSCEIVCRCILITNQLLPDVGVSQCVIVVPPNVIDCQNRTIQILQLSGSQVMIAPNDKYVVHLTTTVKLEQGGENAVAAAVEQGETILRRAVTKLFGDTNHGISGTDCNFGGSSSSSDGVIEWSGYFHDSASIVKQNFTLPKNVYSRKRVRSTLNGAPIDVDAAFDEAQRLFRVVCPNEVFLPERIDPNKSTGGGRKQEDEDNAESDMSGLDDSDDDYGV